MDSASRTQPLGQREESLVFRFLLRYVLFASPQLVLSLLHLSLQILYSCFVISLYSLRLRKLRQHQWVGGCGGHGRLSLLRLRLCLCLCLCLTPLAVPNPGSVYSR